MEIEKDLAEIQRFIDMSQRENVKSYLNIKKEELLKIKEIAYKKEEQENQEQQNAINNRKINFQTIKGYSFDQSDQFENTVYVEILEYQGKNLNFSIKKTNKKINPLNSKSVIKENMLIIKLKKDETGFWDQLEYKESELSKSKMDETKDPQQGLMDMMKKMYNEGDDNMKKTIAEAWQKSNDEKAKKL